MSVQRTADLACYTGEGRKTVHNTSRKTMQQREKALL